MGQFRTRQNTGNIIRKIINYKYHKNTHHKYIPKSSWCVVARNSPVGEIATLDAGVSTRKQSISLNVPNKNG